MSYYDDRYPAPKPDAPWVLPEAEKAEPAAPAPVEAKPDLPPFLTREEVEELAEDILDLTDEEVDEARSKTPEPALVRGGIMAVVGLAAYILGTQIDTAWVDPVVDIYAVAAPVALAWWIRRNVTPVKGKHSK
ncbi:minor tail protein [Mycobacterium phage RhynO]|uniref:minor tail protein n=1 Tax=Mycobacterium phage RhynO TaxID=1458846 RepID=UPI0003F1CCC1|nr:minor tail protein [Mycobacterium phage RhynO]AHJ88688.1 minor tail protein [Mycobacterium phage RhynO]